MDTVQHASALLKTMRSLYQRNLLTDLQLVTPLPKSQIIPVHKMVVASFCTYYREKLEAGTLDKIDVLEGVEADTLSTLIDFMYTGNMAVDSDNLSDILSLANRLGAPMAVEYCQNYIQEQAKDLASLELVPVSADDGSLTKLVINEAETDCTSDKDISKNVPAKKKRGRPKGRSKKVKVEQDMDLAVDHSIQPEKRSTPSRTRKRLMESPSPVRKCRKRNESSPVKNIKLEPGVDFAIKSQDKSKKQGRKRSKKHLRKSASSMLVQRSASSFRISPYNLHHCGVCKEIFVFSSYKQLHFKSHGTIPLHLKMSAFRKSTEISTFCSGSKKVENSNMALKLANMGSPEYHPRSELNMSFNLAQLSSEQLSRMPASMHHNAPNMHPTNSQMVSPSHHNVPDFIGSSAVQIATVQSKSFRNKCFSFTFDINHKKYSCHLCTAVFPLYSLFKMHFIQKHRGIHKCMYCTQKFSSQQSMIMHKRLKHAEESRIFRCTFSCMICNRKFLHAKNLELHSKSAVHSNIERIKQIQCQSCQVTYKHHHNFCHHPCCAQMFSTIKTQYLSHCKNHVIMKSAIKKLRNSKKQLKNSSARRFKCQSCMKTFSLYYHAQLHVRVKHRRSKLYQQIWNRSQKNQRIVCEEPGCSYHGAKLSALEHHVKETHPDVMHSCGRCSFSTPILYLLSRHFYRKHNIANKICEICGKAMKKAHQLRVHRVSKHGIKDPTVKTIVCSHENCTYVAFSKSGLDQHMRKHQEGHQYPCPYCDRKLKTQKNVDKHISKVHMGIRPFICDQCGASYGEESELKMHMARHEADARFRCDYCSYATQDKGNLKSHMWSRHKLLYDKNQRLYQCDKCSYTSDRKTRFSDHLNTHKQVRSFKCKQCDKTFVTKGTMESHLKWVHCNADIQCTFCDYKTKTNYHLKEHVRVKHTMKHVKPYKCPYCEFHCATGGNCRKHVMNKHKGFPVNWVRVTDFEGNEIPGESPSKRWPQKLSEVGNVNSDSGDTMAGHHDSQSSVVVNEVFLDTSGYQVPGPAPVTPSYTQSVSCSPAEPSSQSGYISLIPAVLDHMNDFANRYAENISQMAPLTQQGTMNTYTAGTDRL